MRVLVTGGAGYIGSVLVPKLLARGHQVRVVDVGYFGLGHLRNTRPPIEIMQNDLRLVTKDPGFTDQLLAGVDGIIHLAAISNDPSAELEPELTHQVNFETTVALAEAAKARGTRFVFSSTCSVYGSARDEVDEDGALAPLTAYAISKVDAERQLLRMADSSWRPVILRNGTLYGYSPRMRFDLVVNIFSLFSALRGRITVFGDGLQWRPFLHVRDCAAAFVHFLEDPTPQPGPLNVAHENLRVVDLAERFARARPGLLIEHRDLEQPDQRDYRVSTARLAESGFRARMSVDDGISEIVEAIVAGTIPDPESIFYRNAKWLKELTSLGASDHGGFMSFVETLARSRPPRSG